jgi:hypothetical protein
MPDLGLAKLLGVRSTSYSNSPIPALMFQSDDFIPALGVVPRFAPLDALNPK